MKLRCRCRWTKVAKEHRAKNWDRGIYTGCNMNNLASIINLMQTKYVDYVKNILGLLATCCFAVQSSSRRNIMIIMRRLASIFPETYFNSAMHHTPANSLNIILNISVNAMKILFMEFYHLYWQTNNSSNPIIKDNKEERPPHRYISDIRWERIC